MLPYQHSSPELLTDHLNGSYRVHCVVTNPDPSRKKIQKTNMDSYRQFLLQLRQLLVQFLPNDYLITATSKKVVFEKGKLGSKEETA